MSGAAGGGAESTAGAGAGVGGASLTTGSGADGASVAAGVSEGAESRYGSDSAEVVSGADVPRARGGRPRRRGRRFSLMRGLKVLIRNNETRTANAVRPCKEWTLRLLPQDQGPQTSRIAHACGALRCEQLAKNGRELGARGASAFQATVRHGTWQDRNGHTSTRGKWSRSRTPRTSGGGGRVQVQRAQRAGRIALIMVGAGRSRNPAAR